MASVQEIKQLIDRPERHLVRRGTSSTWEGVVVKAQSSSLVGEGADARIVWTLDEVRSGDSLDGVLWKFIRLDDASDEEILVFARTYGVLGVEDMSDAERRLSQTTKDSLHREWKQGTEYIVGWKQFARGLRALLAAGADLSKFGSVQYERLPTLMSLVVVRTLLSEKNFSETLPVDVLIARLAVEINLGSVPESNGRKHLIVAVLNELLAQSGAIPAITDGDGTEFQPALALPFAQQDVRPETESSTLICLDNLFDVLVVQAVNAVESLKLYICDRCGRPYEPQRKPRADRLNFCSEFCRSERTLERNRDSERKRYAKAKGRFVDSQLDSQAGGSA